jgi:glycosyltransferase involved in cell wall biosynthesis
MGLDLHRSIMMKISAPEETMWLTLCDKAYFCAIIAQDFYTYPGFTGGFHLQVTLVLLTFNQAQFVEQAALACLSQLCEPIEIFFSDDASTDNTFAVLKKIAANYAGPHRLIVRQNDRNLGIGAHYNQVIELAQGDLIITAAGDDVSMPNRVQKILDAWRNLHCKPDLISSYLVDMQFDGHLGATLLVDDLSQWRCAADWVQKRPKVIGAAHAFTKRLHQHFGPFDPRLTFEDQAMALRAAHLGGGLTIKEPLLNYRRGGVSGVEHTFATADGYLKNLKRRHSHQLGMYSQVKKDLTTAGQATLFAGKFERRLARADIFIAMMAARGLKDRSGVFVQNAFRSIASFGAAAQAFVVVSFAGFFAMLRRLK